MNASDLHRHECSKEGCLGAECYRGRIEGCGHPTITEGCVWADQPMVCPDVVAPPERETMRALRMARIGAAAEKRCICGAGVGERHVPLCEAFEAKVLNLDLAQEDRPDPRWLRQLAETLKLEAAILGGFADADQWRTSATCCAGAAAALLSRASEALLELAAALVVPPSDHAAAFLPRVNSSLADTAVPLRAVSPSLAGEAAAGEVVGRPDLEGEG